jgi:hypothetical protein
MICAHIICAHKNFLFIHSHRRDRRPSMITADFPETMASLVTLAKELSS